MSNIRIGKMTLGICGTNTYFLSREDSADTVVVDPADKGQMIYEKLKSMGHEVKAILLTHGHFDHIWGVEELKASSGAEVYASAAEEAFLADARLNMSADYGRPCSIKADHLLKDGEEVTLCGITFHMLSTPGHTAGSCCYYIEEAATLLSGDTLFEESVGRTDFPTGSMSDIVRSVREQLLVLPEDTEVLPGHGGTTTIGHEAKYNMFLV